ncbi:hypothetical protein EFP17_27840 [Burkholderia glumae]|nr:hypothetical protein NCPPB3923_14700 [Burkholderia glumae]PNL05848.1 hypothetical protein CEQ24_008250 [Burkholderia glumae]UVS93410.1 hypothetical protein EFP17_27840 [Burkholderia glumae]
MCQTREVSAGGRIEAVQDEPGRARAGGPPCRRRGLVQQMGTAAPIAMAAVPTRVPAAPPLSSRSRARAACVTPGAWPAAQRPGS